MQSHWGRTCVGERERERASERERKSERVCVCVSERERVAQENLLHAKMPSCRWTLSSCRVLQWVNP